MKVYGPHYRSLWWNSDLLALEIIDQRWLPHDFRIQPVSTLPVFATAISERRVRGAPIIGTTAAYGMAPSMKIEPSNRHLQEAAQLLKTARPTAVNLRWATNRMHVAMQPLEPHRRAEKALALTHFIANEDVETNRMIGVHGLQPIENIASQKRHGETINLLTHCNAGWLATVVSLVRDVSGPVLTHPSTYL